MNNLSYKIKNQLLFVSILLIGYLTFTQSIIASIKTYLSVKDNTEFLITNSSIKNELLMLKREKVDKVVSIESQVKNNNINNDEPLTLISQICETNNLLIWKVAPIVENIQNDFVIQTRTYTINGSYKDLLFLIKHLELNLVRSKIVSINYLIDRTQRNNSPKLLCEIVIKKIIKNENS